MSVPGIHTGLLRLSLIVLTVESLLAKLVSVVTQEGQHWLIILGWRLS
jgi:hypothetical protein